jgi:hypothetical protein
VFPVSESGAIVVKAYPPIDESQFNPDTRETAVVQKSAEAHGAVDSQRREGLFESCGIVPTERAEKRGLKRANSGRMLCCNAVHGRIQMKFAVMCALFATVSVGLSACNKAKSPDEVQTNVAKATSEAAENNAKADANRKQAEAQASEQLAKEKADAKAKATDTRVAAVADSAVTEAEGATKIALAKCEALQGDAQQQCRDEANAHLQTVKDRAKAAKKGPLEQ